MRVMFQDDPGNPANHGYVVSHVGLNNDANWRDFRDFDLEDQEVFRKWLEAQPTNGGDGTGGGRPRRFDKDMMVHDEIISNFVKQSFLDPNDDRIIDKILDIVVPGAGVPFRKFFTRDELRTKLKEAQKEVLDATPQEIPVSPQKRRIGAANDLLTGPSPSPRESFRICIWE